MGFCCTFALGFWRTAINIGVSNNNQIQTKNLTTMKKLFFLASTLLVAGTMSVSARVYVQTANEADPRWTVSLGDNDKLITFTSVADLPTTECKEMWFAAGTYAFDTTFVIMQYDAVLAGGFKGTETSLEEREMLEDGEEWDFAHETILDGGNNVKMLPDNNRRTSFDGLTMQNFRSASNASIVQLRSSADKTPSVKKCKLLNNVAANQGGAFQIYQGSVTFEGCYFDGNTGKQGGAVFANNAADYTLTIHGCYFKGNKAVGSMGGAVHAQNAGKLVVEGCFFESNTADVDYGAALSNNATNESSLVFNNVFVNNEAAESKCVVLMNKGNFYYNTVIESTGNALWAKEGNVKNNVFWATTMEKARVSLGNPNASVMPTAVTNNAGVKAWAEDADATNIVISLNNKPVEGDAEGTKYAYFADPENHEFDLQEGSALVKAGVAIETITTDIDGERRKTADIGAYAYDGTGTAVENIAKPALDIRAALQAGEVYNVLGQRVSDIQAGNIYIVSGQKMLVR